MRGETNVAVLGLGNVLMGDDAAGPHVVARLLSRFTFPPTVSVIDLGTPGLDLAPFLADLRAAVIVDSVRGERPGDIRIFRLPELLAHEPAPRLSPHEPGLSECLLTLELADRAPGDVVVVGIVPDTIDSRTELSPAVRQALPAAVGSVLRELDRLGVPAEERASPAEPDIWWEQPAAMPAR
jgi:hydrogenase maturation protease